MLLDRQRQAVTETAVFNASGRLAFRRVGENVYFGPRRALYVKDGVVYGEDGTPQYYIAGVWWYSYDGEAVYYQDKELDEDPGRAEELRAEEEKAYAAYLEECAAREANKQRAEGRMRARQRRGLFRSLVGG
jgi:hypothetical protein